MWEKASNIVYDLLVSHEVGHALYTPDDDWWDTCKVPKQFVNIVEDVRVEKMMKRRYAGLNKTFYNGYSELSDADFFQINDEDVSTYNLADKVNLYYKIGNFINLPFTDDEKEIAELIGKTETFADVLVASEILYKYCKNQKDEETKISSFDNHDGQPGGNDEQSSGNSEYVEYGDDTKETSSEESSTSSGEETSDKGNKEQLPEPSNSGGDSFEPEIKTASALEKGINQLVDKFSLENVYLEIPEFDIDQIIISNKKIHDECEKTWINNIEHSGNNCIFDIVDKDFVEFKRSAQKEVNYLVKEFECRKAADSYARASTARTGVLDCTKLHTYKHNEDLFKKVTTFANGKNHGLVFILDWSGSMSDVLLDTIKQLYNLIWFCKKVGIPFEVYAFTLEWSRVDYDKNGKAIMPKPLYKQREGIFYVNENFGLLNMFTSKVSSSVLEQQLKNIYRTVKVYERDSHYNYNSIGYNAPAKLSLSGTPLNETLLVLHQILPKFQSENKLQKVQCVILTDGESASLKRHVEVKRNWESAPYIGVSSINSHNTFLRDRKIGNTYKIDNDHYSLTDLLIHNLRDKFSTVNFVGMRIITSRDVGSFIRRYTGYDTKIYSELMNNWKKNKSFSIKNSGYHTYFGLSSNALSNNTQFEVSSDATKGQIKSAFVKSLSSKKMNKKVLGEFVELIA
jgi:hypothetical protein